MISCQKKLFPVKGNDCMPKEMIFCHRILFSVNEKDFQRNGNSFSLKNRYLFKEMHLRKDQKCDGEEISTLSYGTRIRFKILLREIYNQRIGITESNI